MLCFWIMILLTVTGFSLNNLLPVDAQIHELPRPATVPGMVVRGLRYDPKNDVLLFADAKGKTINRCVPDNLLPQTLQLDRSPSFIIPINGQKYAFLVGLGRDIVVLWWDYDAPLIEEGIPQTTYFTCLLTQVDCTCPGNSWYYGTVDAYGNFWGTTNTEQDSLYCDCPPALYRGLTTSTGLLSADVAVRSFKSGGVVYTAIYNIMYTTDLTTRQVYAFKYDLTRGVISCPKIIFKYEDFKLPGFPGSITIDSDGNLWIGSFQGGQVIQINPNTGELLRKVLIPVKEITGVTFGRPQFNVLFVATEVSKSDNITLDSLNPLAGAVFAIRGLGVTGVEAKEAAVNSFCTPFYN